MALTLHPSQAYALLAGLYIGKFTNIFSDAIITCLVLYIVTPEIFTEDRLVRAKNYFWSWFQPRPVKIDISDLSQILLEQTKSAPPVAFDLSKLPKIEVIPSPITIPQSYKQQVV